MQSLGIENSWRFRKIQLLRRVLNKTRQSILRQHRSTFAIRKWSGLDCFELERSCTQCEKDILYWYFALVEFDARDLQRVREGSDERVAQTSDLYSFIYRPLSRARSCSRIVRGCFDERSAAVSSVPFRLTKASASPSTPNIANAIWPGRGHLSQPHSSWFRIHFKHSICDCSTVREADENTRFVFETDVDLSLKFSAGKIEINPLSVSR